MKKYALALGGLLGGVTALIVAALSELGNLLFGLPSISFNLFDWLARHLPGGLLTFFIDTMITTITRLRLGPTSVVAKRVEQGTAVVVFILIGVVFGLVLTAVGRREPARLPDDGRNGGLALFVLAFILLLTLGFPGAGLLIDTAWLAILFVGWGWLLGKLLQSFGWPALAAPTDASRRRFLYLVGAGSVTILVSAAGVDLLTANPSIPNTGPAGGEDFADSLANASATSGPAKSPPKSALAGRFAPVPGTRPELTANADFYRVDINTLAPHIDASTWRLEVGGLVDHPLKLSLDELRSRPSASQAVTQECISNYVGGDLISTTVYRGMRLKDLLAEAGLKPGAQEVYIEAADGFYESVTLQDAQDERTLLVYAMNDQPLAAEHGFPLRISIPNRFGMKQPKWITRLTVIDHANSGYWVDRGWNKDAFIPTTSVVDVVAADAYNPQTGVVQVGGIAFAGARGISKVEVQVDNGPWTPAELRDPPLSPLTWVQWRYNWPAQIGQHTFRVRAYDGSGQLQLLTDRPPEPDGATGVDEKSQFVAQGKRG